VEQEGGGGVELTVGLKFKVMSCCLSLSRVAPSHCYILRKRESSKKRKKKKGIML